MRILRITIKFEPVAKGRARTSIANGNVWTYTPRKTKEAQVFLTSRLERHKHDQFPPHVPVKLTATFFRKKSKWLPKKESLPVRKPDLDNFLKLLSDALNGVLVSDDAQITSLTIKKRWTTAEYGYIQLKLEEDKE